MRFMVSFRIACHREKQTHRGSSNLGQEEICIDGQQDRQRQRVSSTETILKAWRAGYESELLVIVIFISRGDATSLGIL